MKSYAVIFSFFFLTLNIHAQSDSIFTDLTSYSVEVCTHAWDWEGLDQYEHLTVFSDDPISDTLRVKDVAGNVFASLWLDGRKTWLKVNSNRLNNVAQYVFSPYYNYSTDYPLDEYFLLYDFEVLDTAVVGDTLTFPNSSKDVTFSIADIDTIQINNVEKVRYRIMTGQFGQRRDYLIEGIGGLHPLTPLIEQGFFGTCSCHYEAIYSSPTDTLVLRDTMIFGNIGEFCLTAGLSEYEKINSFNFYPNPVTGNTFTIQADGNARIDEVSLYDNLGKEIEAKYSITKNASHCTVSTLHLSKGFYTVEIVSNSKYFRHKIIIR